MAKLCPECGLPVPRESTEVHDTFHFNLREILLFNSRVFDKIIDTTNEIRNTTLGIEENIKDIKTESREVRADISTFRAETRLNFEEIKEILKNKD